MNLEPLRQLLGITLKDRGSLYQFSSTPIL